MLRQALHEMRIPTRGRGLYEFTAKVGGLGLAPNGFRNGLVTLHLRHTSASLLIQENADPDVRRDLEPSSPAWCRTAIRCSSTRPKATTTCPRMCAPR